MRKFPAPPPPRSVAAPTPPRRPQPPKAPVKPVKAPPAPAAPKRSGKKGVPHRLLPREPITSRQLAPGETLAALRTRALDLYNQGVSDPRIAAELELSLRDVMLIRSLNEDLQLTKRPAQKPRLRDVKPKSERKPAPSHMRAEIGEDGLPVRKTIPGYQAGRPKGSVDIVKFLNDLSTYSIEELEELLEFKTKDGKSLSINTLSLARLYLDCLTAPRMQDRVKAQQTILNRRFGLPTAKVANADGSNLSPLAALLTADSKLVPSDD